MRIRHGRRNPFFFLFLLMTMGFVAPLGATEKTDSRTEDARSSSVLQGYQKKEIVFSPDGKRTAYAAKKGGKEYFVLDGRKSAPYDSV